MMMFLGRKSPKTLRCDSDKVPVPVGFYFCCCKEEHACNGWVHASGKSTKLWTSLYIKPRQAY